MPHPDVEISVTRPQEISRFVFICVFSFLILATPSDAAVVIDLGTLGGTNSVAYGVNNSGQVVGRADTGTGSGTVFHAFIWESGVMTGLGSFAGSGFSSFATSINNASQVSGAARTSDATHAFRWQSGIMTDLGTLNNSTGHSTGYAINSFGQVVGQSYTVSNDPSTPHAFRWVSGSMADLGVLGGSVSSARGMNDNGQVVGFTTTPFGGGPSAFIWQNGVMTDLGIPATESIAHDINNSGQVVGGASTGHAFLWQNGNITDLGANSTAYAISNSGQIVGTSNNHAVLWQNGNLIDLDAIASIPGWTLTEALAISDDGNWIAGYLTSTLPGGQTHAFVMTGVPEPSAFVLSGMVLVTSMMRWRAHLRSRRNCK